MPFFTEKLLNFTSFEDLEVGQQVYHDRSPVWTAIPGSHRQGRNKVSAFDANHERMKKLEKN